MRFGIAGAGFSGAVIARELAEAGHDAVVFETRDHVAGNCHTERDPETAGDGPPLRAAHLPHRQRARLGLRQPVRHDDAVQPPRPDHGAAAGCTLLPVNLLTINQFFGTAISPDEAQAFIAEQADSSIAEPRNFEEQALKFMGRRLYEAFFLGYTRKQWGLRPTELPGSMLKRLPLRFNYDDTYFNHPHQAIPRGRLHRRSSRRSSTTPGSRCGCRPRCTEADREGSTTRSGPGRWTPGSATATAGSAIAPWTSRRSAHG